MISPATSARRLLRSRCGGDESKLANFVQDDIIYAKVVSLGSYSYDTQIGGGTTVPLFYAVYFGRPDLPSRGAYSVRSATIGCRRAALRAG